MLKPIEGNPNRFNKIVLYLLSPNPSFSNPDSILPTSPRRLKAFGVACRSQGNPGSISPDGVSPEFVVLGLRGVPVLTSLIGWQDRSDRPAQELCW